MLRSAGVQYKLVLLFQVVHRSMALTEIFCPAVGSEYIRTFTALAAQSGLRLYQMDVTTAFLNGDLEEKSICNSQRFYNQGPGDLVYS